MSSQKLILPKKYICFKCKLQFDVKLNVCLCGWRKTIFKNKTGQASLVKIEGSVPLSFLNEIPPEKKSLIEEFEIFGEVTNEKAIMIWGAPGSRKSTLCLMLMDKIAKTLPSLNHEIFSREEGFKGTFREKTTRLGIGGPNLFVSEPKSFSDIMRRVQTKRLETVCVDSASSMKLSVAEMKEIASAVPTSIFIYHATKANSYKGGTDHEHEWDIVVNVENGIARTNKNRFHITSNQLDKFELDSQIDIDEMQKIYESRKKKRVSDEVYV